MSKKDNKVLNNDYQMERLLNELREFTDEKERLIDISKKMIEEYQDKVKFYEEQIQIKEEYTKGQIFSLIEVDKMKDTKTQKSYQLVSGKITITKDKYNMKLKAEYNENTIPDNFIEVKRSVKWGEYKKTLTIVDNQVVNKETGEIVDNVDIEKVEGGQINLKLVDSFKVNHIEMLGPNDKLPYEMVKPVEQIPVEIAEPNNNLIDSVAVVFGQDDILNNEYFENLINEIDSGVGESEKKDT